MEKLITAGDSIFIPLEGREYNRAVTTIFSSSYRHNQAITTQNGTVNGEQGVLVTLLAVDSIVSKNDKRRSRNRRNNQILFHTLSATGDTAFMPLDGRRASECIQSIAVYSIKEGLRCKAESGNRNGVEGVQITVL
jgi:hypothetical protein